MNAPQHPERWSDEKLNEFHQEFRQHRQEEQDRWDKVMTAFPNEDPLKHRMYHEAVMRAAEAQEKFWNELRLDLAKKSFWAVAVLIVGLLLSGLALKVGMKFP